MLQPWFGQARFGLFIHWGLYAIAGTHEWHLHQTADYDGYLPWANEFNPEEFDPEHWAELAWDAGMRYVVFTTKHHDGFCMYDNPYTEFKITNAPYRHDITSQIVDAFRKRGHRIGFYHSLIDWHHPHYVPDGHHPLGKADPTRQWPDRDMRKYAQYLYDSVEHLMTSYGTVDLLFWDYVSPWKKASDFNPGPLVEMIRRHQPQIMINDRLSDPHNRDGDFCTPEGGIPNLVPNKPWEVCAAMNYYWGYHQDAKVHMSPSQIQNALMTCVSRNGNLLLNVGPDELGRIPQPSKIVMEQLAQWHVKHQSAVQGTGPSKYEPPIGCIYTASTNDPTVMYLYMPLAPLGDLYLPGLKDHCVSATLLRDGVSLPLEVPLQGFAAANDLHLKAGGSCSQGDVVRLQLK